MYEKNSAAQSGAAGRDSMTLAGGDDHLNAFASNDVEKRTSKQDRKSGLIRSGSDGAADIEERAVGAEGDCESSPVYAKRNAPVAHSCSILACPSQSTTIHSNGGRLAW